MAVTGLTRNQFIGFADTRVRIPPSPSETKRFACEPLACSGRITTFAAYAVVHIPSKYVDAFIDNLQESPYHFRRVS